MLDLRAIEDGCACRYLDRGLPLFRYSRLRKDARHSEFGHHGGLHFLDEPPTIDAYQGIIRVGVRGDLVCRLIDVETFEIEVSTAAVDLVFDAERRGISDPLVLRLKCPGRLPEASDLLFPAVGLAASGDYGVVGEATS
jgi:hypothetical protein